MRLIDFLIVGTPKSGTRYIQRIFNELGIECGHERHVGPNTIQLYREKEKLFGSVDYGAVGILHQIPHRIVLIQHLRHPVDACNSMMKTSTFRTWRTFAPIWGTPELYDPSNNYNNMPARQRENEAVFYWYNLNIRMAAHCHIRWQIERTDEIKEGIYELFSVLKKWRKEAYPDISRSKISDVVDGVPTNVGHNKGDFRKLTTMTWNKLGFNCCELAGNLGYEDRCSVGDGSAVKVVHN